MGPKRRRFQIRQKRKRRIGRQKFLNLSLEESSDLKQFKERGQFAVAEHSRVREGYARGINNRDLEDVQGMHKTVFSKVVEKLAKRFPRDREIIILYEGAGIGTFPAELQKELAGRVKVRFIRTDIDPEAHPDFMLSPEEFSRRFKEKPHLIISTMGGATYTRINQEKALANIIHVLKPGGMAYVLSEENQIFTGARKITVQNMKRMLKNFRNISVTEMPGLWGPKTHQLIIHKLNN